MGSSKHFPEWAPKELHQNGKVQSEKGCLVKCKKTKGFKEGNECSYRWQAYIHAEIDCDVYNYPAYADICVSKDDEDAYFRTGARKTKKGKCFPAGYAKEWMGYFWKQKPTHEGKEWDLGKGKNFRNWDKPFWHNAHHVVPASMLKAAIVDTGEIDSRLPTYIGQGLMKGQYNLHDLENMIILPQGTNVAYALKLPRHLRGDEVGPGVDAEYANHPDYNKFIKDKLTPIIDSYSESLAEGLSEDHPPAPAKLSKQALVNASKTTYKDIISKGGESPGQAISDIFSR